MTGVGLAITASRREFSIALRSQDGVVTNFDSDVHRSASDLGALVASAFDSLDLQPSCLEELRLDVGPGSYTGLRVAVTFARVAHAFRDVEILTTTSLELMTLATFIAGRVANNAIVRPVIDARRHRFHHAAVRTGDIVELAETPRAEELAALEASIQKGETLLAESTLHDTVRSLVGSDIPVLTPSVWNAALLFDPRLGVRNTPGDELQPLYLMGSYAE